MRIIQDEEKREGDGRDSFKRDISIYKSQMAYWGLFIVSPAPTVRYNDFLKRESNH